MTVKHEGVTIANIYLFFKAVTLFFTLIYSGSVFAEEFESYKLDDIVVSAAKIQTSVTKTPTNILVITREDIEKMPNATTVNELLKQTPGLYVPQFQSGVANDGIYSSRGSEPTTWGLRFLVNGVEFNKGNGYTVPTRIPLNDVERIEIVKTPSAEYGDQAVGGVINVITRVSKKPLEAKLGMDFGDFEYSNYSGVINGSNDRFEYFGDISFSQSDGFQDDVNYDHANFYTRLAYNFNDTTIMEFHGSHMHSTGAWPDALTQEQFDHDPSQNPGKADPFENDYDLGAIVLKKYFGDDELQIKLTGKDEWVAMNFGLDFEFDEWELFPAVTYTWRHEIAGMPNVVLFGLEYREHELITELWTIKDGKRITKTKDTLREDTSLAAFIMDEFSPTERLNLTFGIRFDTYEQDQTGRVNPANTVSQSDEAFSPKLGFTYTFNPSINLFGGYNSGFKSPARVPGAAYSADLEPEKVVSWEIGFRGTPKHWFRYNIAGFLNRYEDKWLKIGPDPNDPYTNSGQTEAKGVEMGVGLSFDYGLFFDLNYTYQESKYDDFAEGGVRYDGNWLPNIPEQLFGILAGYHQSRLGQLSFTADYIGERYFNKENKLKGDDYWVFGAAYKKVLDQLNPNLSLSLTVSNLTDEEAVVYGSGGPGNESLSPIYGRRIIAGVELLF